MKKQEKHKIAKNEFIQEKLIGIQLIGTECEAYYNNHVFKGIIELETKNTIHLKTKNETKIIPKESSTLKITQNDQIYQFEGTKLIGRHENRIKRRIKRKW